MSEWNIPQKYLDQQKEIERLRAELAAVQECELDLLERDIKAGDEIERLRAALEEIAINTPRGNSVEGCRRIAREALRDD